MRKGKTNHLEHSNHGSALSDSFLDVAIADPQEKSSKEILLPFYLTKFGFIRENLLRYFRIIMIG